MSAEMVGLSLIVIGILLVIGKWLRIQIPIFQKLYLPTSIIAGFIALLLGPEVLGRVIGTAAGDDVMTFGLFLEEIYAVWETLPGLLINVVFACLFLGFTLPKWKDIWFVGGPQISFGYTLSWGQYVFGILLVLLVLVPFFNMSPAAGALIEIGFVGGHGTAAGMAGTFEQIGFPEGYDLAVGLATVGILSGVIIGIILINVAVRKGQTNILKKAEDISWDQQLGVIQEERRESAGKMTTSPISIEPLALHFAYIGIAIFIGFLLLEGLIWLESVTWAHWVNVELMGYMPLFPFAMIGGVIVQAALTLFDRYDTIDRGLINRVQGLALDWLIVSALATLSLQVLGSYFVPFILLSLVGIMWNVLAFVYIAPRMIPNYWFERGMGDLGQSMGVAATGLLLMRVVDPENRSPALNAFGYKQLLFEPIVGGGLFTAASVPLIIQFGAVPVLILTTVLMLICFAFGIFYFGRK
ncbi:glutamate:Na+ symporter, ESS family [Alteribacillus persepolensis]|uniref:Glutamate:Na+ symporter, ESS family n=1 Tax=Alteribacillus persepolensis TaxID=568899 RepID=A0A1G8IUV2_9BACI|nr:sodium/glutamate symporter [Alteribacillus persepolensis]SDI22754.1 glutamate:Na+ symporter, ESS family [Alteribacillus persepolensis]